MHLLDFIVKNNQHLTEMNVALTSDVEKLIVKNLMITGNPKLTSIKITAPAGFSGNVMISGNDNLNSVELIIPKIECQEDFKIENNPMLTKLNLPIKQFQVDKQLLVINNKALANFNLDQLNQFIVNGGWPVVFCRILVTGAEISKNENLETILINKGTTFTLHRMEVVKNPKLTTIGEDFSTTLLTVHGNPSLAPAILQTLNTFSLNGSDIQPEGGLFLILQRVTIVSFQNVCLTKRSAIFLL